MPAWAACLVGPSADATLRAMTDASRTQTLAARRAELRRMKIGAAALLVLMVAGLILAHAMGGQGGWAWLRAFCEAATVGALADWFAVVALFRHPLGIPVPHTAIIPSNKDRLADKLGVFVRDHFLEPGILMARIQAFDPAARLGQWLAVPDNTRRLAQGARQAALQSLELLDEVAVRRAIHGFVMGRLHRWNAAATAGDVLGLLTRDGRHQELLDAALERMAQYLGKEEIRQRVSALLVKHASREWPRLVGAVELVSSVDDIADRLADRMSRALLEELREVLSASEHPLRQEYEAWFADYVTRLRDDPDLAHQAEAIKQRLMDHPDVQEYVRGLWDDIHDALRRDLMRDDSVLARHLDDVLLALGRKVSEDASLRDAINAHVMANAETLTEDLREEASAHIARTVKAWDERKLVDELELSVGRDLQYIRYNGTLVGGLIGLALHALVLAASA